jgi:hypothetical protein
MCTKVSISINFKVGKVNFLPVVDCQANLLASFFAMRLL